MSIYTHGHDIEVLNSHSWRTAENSAAYLLPYLDADAHVLDIGAGPGTISVDFAHRVSRVTATEIGDHELKFVRALAHKGGTTNMEFAVQDVGALTFPDNSFDVVHAHQVLQHVVNPVAALGEMCRVTKPGGIVAVRDADYSAFAWWPLTEELEAWRQLYFLAARANGGEPQSGRRLLSWAHAAGMVDCVASTSTWCFSTPLDRAAWAKSWSHRITKGPLASQLQTDFSVPFGQLVGIAEGWENWASDDDGWMSLLHGEILYRKPV